MDEAACSLFFGSLAMFCFHYQATLQSYIARMFSHRLQRQDRPCAGTRWVPACDLGMVEEDRPYRCSGLFCFPLCFVFGESPVIQKFVLKVAG